MRRLTASLAILAFATTPVLAAPKKKAAKAEFDKGVAAYTKGDYAGASDALGKSFGLEADAETLFAWAQTERKLDHCDKAVDLYAKLLAMNLPEENKQAVRVQVDECKAIIAAQPKPDPKPDPKPVDPKPLPTDTPDPNPTAVAQAEPAQHDALPPPHEDKPSGTAWWKNPVGGVLVGLGVVGVGLGTVFMVQGSAADSDKANAPNYDEYMSLADKAESKGTIGVIGLAAGGALIVGGVIWYATHSGSSKPADKTVSGWVTPDSGGLVVTGGF